MCKNTVSKHNFLISMIPDKIYQKFKLCALQKNYSDIFIKKIEIDKG